MSKRETESSSAKEEAESRLADAVEALRRGEVIVFPTETFYGLGANALDPAAVQRVVAIKGRDVRQPIPLLVADVEMLEQLVAEVPPVAHRLIERFWPGPLTLVLPSRGNLPAPLLNASGGVGARVSSHPVATRIVSLLGAPLTATSANPSGLPPARRLAEAESYFSGQMRLFLDGGELPGRRGSTVVEIAGGEIKVIREGEIPEFELRRAVSGDG